MKRFLLSVVLVFCCAMAHADTVYYFSGMVQTDSGNQLIAGQFSLDPATKSITSFYFNGPNGPFSSGICATPPGACHTSFSTSWSDTVGMAIFMYDADYVEPYWFVQSEAHLHFFFNASDFASLDTIPILTPSNSADQGSWSYIHTYYEIFCDPCKGLPETKPPHPPLYNDDGFFVSGAFSTDPSKLPEVPEPCSAVMVAIGVAGIMSRRIRGRNRPRREGFCAPGHQDK